MKKTKVLVTGGGGFIGKHLIELLRQKGYIVSSYERGNVNLGPGIHNFQGDVLDKQALNKAMKDQDEVYHLAGLLGTSELQYQSVKAAEINIIGAINVFDAALKYGTKVILISKPNPWLNTYSVTKEASEKFCQIYQRYFGLKAVIIKWFNVYGPGQKYKHVQKAVPTFIIQALKNQPLPVYDDGKQQGDFVYVTDSVNATIKIANTPKALGKTVEIGTGVGTTVNKLAKLIIKLSNSKSKIQYLPMRIGENPHTLVVAKLTELKKLYVFKPEVDLISGLKLTIDYYRKLLAK